MTTVGTICYAFIGPLLADASSSVDAGPTYLLAAACTAFLTALGWAIRQAIVWSKDGSKLLYGEVIKPLAASQRELMETLNQTRKADSAALATLAADVHALRSDIKCRHDA